MHEFNFPAIRAVLPLLGLEELWPEALSLAYDVPYSDRFDVKVMVAFTGGTEEGWRASISSVGGQVDDVIGGYKLVSAIIPDESVAALRADSLVDFVEHNGQFCQF